MEAPLKRFSKEGKDYRLLVDKINFFIFLRGERWMVKKVLERILKRMISICAVKATRSLMTIKINTYLMKRRVTDVHYFAVESSDLNDLVRWKCFLYQCFIVVTTKWMSFYTTKLFQVSPFRYMSRSSRSGVGASRSRESYRQDAGTQ